jgi:hypothetical protein
MAIPHQGGRRFRETDPEFQILRDWIAAGSPGPSDVEPALTGLHVEPREVLLRDPDDSFQVSVTAAFSDGSRRDVTRLAVYEPAMPIVNVSLDGEVRRLDFGETTIIVRYLERKTPIRLTMIPRREEFVWNGPEPANFIDEHVFAKLRGLRVNPSPVSDDAAFLRRLSLDLLGIPPTADEARAFVEDDAADKRERLVERLLERPEFADHWALKWSDLLRIEEKTLDRKGVRVFHAWLRNAFANNLPFDEMVRQIVAARGSSYLNPPANYYRALRDPESRAESTAQLFLGIRLQCAKCHNHPFDRWTQDDYYGWTNFFARVDYKVLANNRRDNNDKHEFDGEQLVLFTDKGSVKHPGTGEVPALRYLGEGESEPIDQQRTARLAGQLDRESEQPSIRRVAGEPDLVSVDRNRDRRSDRRFSRDESSQSSRTARIAGAEFIRSEFNRQTHVADDRQLENYQLSSQSRRNQPGRNAKLRPGERSPADRRADRRRDRASRSMRGRSSTVSRGNAGRTDRRRSRGASPRPPKHARRNGPVRLGEAARLQSCECERSDETTLGQVFQMVSGDFVQSALAQPDNRLAQLTDARFPPDRLVEELYWSILNRPPNSEERVRMEEYLRQATEPRASLEDIAWSLINTKEFLFRH